MKKIYLSIALTVLFISACGGGGGGTGSSGVESHGVSSIPIRVEIDTSVQNDLSGAYNLLAFSASGALLKQYGPDEWQGEAVALPTETTVIELRSESDNSTVAVQRIDTRDPQYREPVIIGKDQIGNVSEAAQRFENTMQRMGDNFIARVEANIAFSTNLKTVLAYEAVKDLGLAPSKTVFENPWIKGRALFRVERGSTANGGTEYDDMYVLASSSGSPIQDKIKNINISPNIHTIKLSVRTKIQTIADGILESLDIVKLKNEGVKLYALSASTGSYQWGEIAPFTLDHTIDGSIGEGEITLIFNQKLAAKTLHLLAVEVGGAVDPVYFMFKTADRDDYSQWDYPDTFWRVKMSGAEGLKEALTLYDISTDDSNFFSPDIVDVSNLENTEKYWYFEKRFPFANTVGGNCFGTRVPYEPQAFINTSGGDALVNTDSIFMSQPEWPYAKNVTEELCMPFNVERLDKASLIQSLNLRPDVLDSENHFMKVRVPVESAGIRIQLDAHSAPDNHGCKVFAVNDVFVYVKEGSTANFSCDNCEKSGSVSHEIWNGSDFENVMGPYSYSLSSSPATQITPVIDAGKIYLQMALDYTGPGVGGGSCSPMLTYRSPSLTPLELDILGIDSANAATGATGSSGTATPTAAVAPPEDDILVKVFFDPKNAPTYVDWETILSNMPMEKKTKMLMFVLTEGLGTSAETTHKLFLEEMKVLQQFIGKNQDLIMDEAGHLTLTDEELEVLTHALYGSKSYYQSVGPKAEIILKVIAYTLRNIPTQDTLRDESEEEPNIYKNSWGALKAVNVVLKERGHFSDETQMFNWENWHRLELTRNLFMSNYFSVRAFMNLPEARRPNFVANFLINIRQKIENRKAASGDYWDLSDPDTAADNVTTSALSIFDMFFLAGFETLADPGHATVSGMYAARDPLRASNEAYYQMGIQASEAVFAAMSLFGIAMKTSQLAKKGLYALKNLRRGAISGALGQTADNAVTQAFVSSLENIQKSKGAIVKSTQAPLKQSDVIVRQSINGRIDDLADMANASTKASQKLQAAGMTDLTGQPITETMQDMVKARKLDRNLKRRHFYSQLFKRSGGEQTKRLLDELMAEQYLGLFTDGRRVGSGLTRADEISNILDSMGGWSGPLRNKNFKQTLMDLYEASSHSGNWSPFIQKLEEFKLISPRGRLNYYMAFISEAERSARIVHYFEDIRATFIREHSIIGYGTTPYPLSALDKASILGQYRISGQMNPPIPNAYAEAFQLIPMAKKAAPIATDTLIRLGQKIEATLTLKEFQAGKDLARFLSQNSLFSDLVQLKGEKIILKQPTSITRGRTLSRFIRSQNRWNASPIELRRLASPDTNPNLLDDYFMPLTNVTGDILNRELPVFFKDAMWQRP